MSTVYTLVAYDIEQPFTQAYICSFKQLPSRSKLAESLPNFCLEEIKFEDYRLLLVGRRVTIGDLCVFMRETNVF